MHMYVHYKIREQIAILTVEIDWYFTDCTNMISVPQI